MDVEAWMVETLRKLEVEYKDDYETAYGVEIQTDALFLSCSIVRIYSDALLLDEDGGIEKHDVRMQKKAAELVEKACIRLRHELDSNVEENALDMQEYLLHRTLVELDEIKREKDLGRRYWIPRLQKEHENLMDKWDEFVKKWKLIVPLRTKSVKRAEEIYMLEHVRQGLVSCLQEVEVVNGMDSNPFYGVVQHLGALVTELVLATNENVKQNLFVTPRIIAEVASPWTGVPASWLLRFSEPPVQGLEPRLSERLVGQEHVLFAISNALTRPRVAYHPLGSFLFVYGSGMGRTELAKALAKQLFDDKDVLVTFDLSEYAELQSVSRLIARCDNHEECAARGLLTEAVKRRPFSVVLFDNIDRAHSSVIDFLIEIISHGRVSDGHGSTVDFSKTLIIMTSNVMDFKFSQWGCKCVKMIREVPLKDLCHLDPLEQPKHRCTYFSLLQEAKSHFRPELFEKLDDVIFFECLPPEQYMAITRLQLRDIAISVTGKKLILYPSEAALRYIVSCSVWPQMGGDATRIWLEENVVPVLLDMLAKNETDGTCTIYIDALVGANELSYRVEKGGCLVEHLFLKQFNQSLRELRVAYHKEKERANKIYLLRRNFFGLMNLLDPKAVEDLACAAEVVRELVRTVDDLITNAIDVYFMPKEYEMAPVNFSNEDPELEHRERPSKRSKNGLQGLLMRLCNRVRGENQAIDVVAEAMFESINKGLDLPNQPAMSFLTLGLKIVGKAHLVEGLAEEFITDDGTSLLIQVQLSHYTDSESLSRLINGPLELPLGQEQHGLTLLEAVRLRPHSILLFSCVEKAHISVFSALLSILDRGMLSDNEGHTVDFRSTILILTSELGNKAILPQLFGHAYRDCLGDANTEQENGGFRSELLNRVDEIMFFNPLDRDQLSKIARLSMRAGPHLEEGPPLALYMAFLQLFKDVNDPILESKLHGMERAVSRFKRGLIINDRSGSVHSHLVVNS